MSDQLPDPTPSDIRTIWQPVVSALRQLGAPCEIQWLGGGCIVMEIASEDPDDRVWLGAQLREPIDDGPWLTPFLDAGVVGGYRHRWNHVASADDSSALDSEPVSMPGDTLSVAEAMSAVWRRLRTADLDLPTPEIERPRTIDGPTLDL